MAMGIPCITTGFGGQVDFVNKENGWLIDYELIDVTWDMQYEGVKWAKPNIEHLRKLMRYCYENQQEVKVKAKLALEESKKWTWENSAKKAKEFLEEIK